MRRKILTCFAVTSIMALAGCASQPKPKPATTKATALTSCESDRVLPPNLDGAARTGSNSQPVLIVGCALN